MLTIEFEFTPEEIRQAQRAITMRSWRRLKWGRVLMTLLIIVAVMMGLTLLRDRNAPPIVPASQPAAPQDLLNDFVLPLVPWLAIFGVIWFFVFRRLRGGQIKDSTLLGRHWMVQADEQGLVYADALERSQRSWELFREFHETPHFFLLYIGRILAVPIPKRPMTTPNQVEAWRTMLQSHISPRTHGFPINLVDSKGNT